MLFYYFLFCPFSRRIFQNFDFFFRYFTKNRSIAVALSLPDVVFAPSLSDPAQLVGSHQLLEVVHTLPQHLALVGVLHENAMIFGLQNVFLGNDIQIILHRFLSTFKGLMGAQGHLSLIHI